MSLQLDKRQRAMLREMGVRVWQPMGAPPMPATVDAAIDATGAVVAAAPRTDADCALPETIEIAPFTDAALAAVRRWTYAPALLCVAPETFDGTDACQADGVIETPTAVRLSYAFRFSQQAGTPEVERVGAP